MGIRMTKPWVALTADAIAVLPAQLGVYELADRYYSVLRVGFAGGTEPFGMRSALERELQAFGENVSFRVEFTHGYLTRSQELLMVHQADHGSLPAGNRNDMRTLGRLSPSAPAAPTATTEGCAT